MPLSLPGASLNPLPSIPSALAEPLRSRKTTTLLVLGSSLLWVLVMAWLLRGSDPVLQGGVVLVGPLALSGLTYVLARQERVRVLDVVKERHHETRDYLVRFFDQLPLGALILDPGGHVQHCNRRAVGMLGIPEEVISATDWKAPGFMVLGADGNAFQAEEHPVARVLATGQRVEGVVMGIERSDGDWSWVGITAEPRWGRNGALEDIILVLEDVTRFRTMEAELLVQTFRDRLTGLPNRSLFMERLAQAIVRTGRRKLPCAVLFLDLDRFKVVNDSLSHDQGDQLLIQVARRLRVVMRPEDTVARLGGDEFVVLFEEVGNAADAIRVADRIQQAFQEPFLLGAQEIFTTCSMGLVLSSDPTLPPADLLRDAEVAMYRAKARAKGEGAIELFDPSMNRQALQRLQMEGEMRRALDRQEFLLHFQPVVGLVSGRIEGWEALVRWKHPERGMVSPLDFISLAEENGLIVPIGKWVVEEACRHASRWHQTYVSDPPRLMNVNISGRQFQAKDLIDTVMSALDTHGLPPRLLKLEITESVMMQDPKASLQVMKIFKTLNIHLVIDDFGTGYSSLAYLKRFPVDTLKVDKSFVDGLGKDPEDTVIVQAVISLAKSLGMRVVAEGIETAEQLAMLRAMGCDQGQGYLFSRPVPVPEAEALLQRDPVW